MCIFLQIRHTNGLKIFSLCIKGDDSEMPFGCYEKGLRYKNNSEKLVYQDRERRWLLKDRDGTVVMAATRLPHQTAVGPTFLPISIAIPLPSSSEPTL